MCYVPFGRAASKFSSKVCVLSHVQLFATPQTVSRQAPLSMEFPRQEYWNGLPFPIPVDLPDQGTEPATLASPVLGGRFFTTLPPGKPIDINDIKEYLFFLLIILKGLTSLFCEHDHKHEGSCPWLPSLKEGGGCSVAQSCPTLCNPMASCPSLSPGVCSYSCPLSW